MRTCRNCGAKDHDRRRCPKLEKPKGAEPAPRPAAPAPDQARGRIDLEACTIEELVNLRTAVNAQLRVRKEKLEAELEKVTEVVG